MAQQRRGERVLGPYSRRGKWRVIVVSGGGERTYRDYATQAEAAKVIRLAVREMQAAEERTIENAEKAYKMYLRTEKQNKPGSVEDTEYRLGMFFCEVDEEGKVVRGLDGEALSSITPKMGAELYAGLRRRKAKGGKALAVDSHRNILAEARSFLKWCVGKKWIARNPLDGIEGVGRRRHGKEQIRIDEARTWLAKATERADAGEEGAVAAMLALLLGMRATEIITRLVRDLDDEGRLLWIPETKTAAGRRTLQVPELVRGYLRQIAKGKGPQDLLFGCHWRDWPREWVQRICREAGVPEITAHGMRGLHSTLAVDSGITGHAVAAALGHESFEKTTAGSYVQPGAVANAQQRQVLKVLAGGRN